MFFFFLHVLFIFVDDLGVLISCCLFLDFLFTFLWWCRSPRFHVLCFCWCSVLFCWWCWSSRLIFWSLFLSFLFFVDDVGILVFFSFLNFYLIFVGGHGVLVSFCFPGLMFYVLFLFFIGLFIFISVLLMMLASSFSFLVFFISYFFGGDDVGFVFFLVFSSCVIYMSLMMLESSYIFSYLIFIVCWWNKSKENSKNENEDSNITSKQVNRT